MPLTPAEITSRISRHPGWAYANKSLARQFVFKGFPDAIAFVTRLAFDAEAADHHPDLLISYKRVTVTWSTHSEGGVTEKDFDGVEQSDRIGEALGVRL